MSTLVPVVLTVFLVFFLCLFACALVMLFTVLRRLAESLASPPTGGTAPQKEKSAQTAPPTPLTIPGWYWPGQGEEMVE